jgi:H+/Cl- antiporter ClcA
MTGAYHHIPAVVLTAYIAAFTANALHSEPVYDSLRARCLDLARAATPNGNNGNDTDDSAMPTPLQK